jgi:hypothetical protein
LNAEAQATTTVNTKSNDNETSMKNLFNTNPMSISDYFAKKMNKNKESTLIVQQKEEEEATQQSQLNGTKKKKTIQTQNELG